MAYHGGGESVFLDYSRIQSTLVAAGEKVVLISDHVVVPHWLGSGVMDKKGRPTRRREASPHSIRSRVTSIQRSRVEHFVNNMAPLWLVAILHACGESL